MSRSLSSVILAAAPPLAADAAFYVVFGAAAVAFVVLAVITVGWAFRQDRTGRERWLDRQRERGATGQQTTGQPPTGQASRQPTHAAGDERPPADPPPRVVAPGARVNTLPDGAPARACAPGGAGWRSGAVPDGARVGAAADRPPSLAGLSRWWQRSRPGDGRGRSRSPSGPRSSWPVAAAAAPSRSGCSRSSSTAASTPAASTARPSARSTAPRTAARRTATG